MAPWPSSITSSRITLPRPDCNSALPCSTRVLMNTVLAPAWQALRWDLEELRVSIFAQEQGTRRQVSAKRLSRQLEALT